MTPPPLTPSPEAVEKATNPIALRYWNQCTDKNTEVVRILSTAGTGVNRDNEVVEAITKCEDAQDAATRLVDHALLYSCQDNATALVLPLGSWGKGEGTSGMFYSFGRAMSNSSRFG